MALSSLRLRRALTSLSSLRRAVSSVPALSSPAPPLASVSAPAPARSASWSTMMLQSRTFRSSSLSLSASRPSSGGDSEFGPDDVLFEGCDYKHWLFVIDFPKDVKHEPYEMVAKYEEICAKGLNISIEEARTKIYACSTTTYNGFQAVMSEEEAEKFHDIPGVVFVLPDSYLYPETKEYGGDKYVNGQITPRPPPVQYRKQPPRSHDREARPVPNRQQNPNYNDQGGVRNSPAPQNYGPTGQVDRRGQTPNYQPPQDYGSYGQGNRSGPRQNYRQDYSAPELGDRRGPVQDYMPPQNYGAPEQGDRRGLTPNYRPPQDYRPAGQGEIVGPLPNHGAPQNFGPPGQGDKRDAVPNFGDPQNYRQPRQGGGRGPWPNNSVSENYGQPGLREGRDAMHPYSGPYHHHQPGNYPQEQEYYPRREHSGYPPTGQRDFSGDNRNYAPSRCPTGRGPETDAAQAYQEPGDGQMFPKVERKDPQGEHMDYTTRGQTGTNQGRY